MNFYIRFIMNYLIDFIALILIKAGEWFWQFFGKNYILRYKVNKKFCIIKLIAKCPLDKMFSAILIDVVTNKLMELLTYRLMLSLIN